MVSALKKDGKIGELARKGIEIEREARPAKFHSIDVSKVELPKVEFTLHCSKGTYVRVLCHDMGRALDSAAYMSGLRRSKSGQFSIDGAITATELKQMEREDVEKLIIPIENLELAED